MNKQLEELIDAVRYQFIACELDYDAIIDYIKTAFDLGQLTHCEDDGK